MQLLFAKLSYKKYHNPFLMAAATLHIPVSALVLEPAVMPATKAAQDATAVVAELLTQATGPLLDQYKQVFTQQLLALPVGTHKALKSKLIRLIAHLDERREEAELAADPARRAGIERVGEHFARKAQSGFSAGELPRLTVEEQTPENQAVKLQRRKPKP